MGDATFKLTQLSPNAVSGAVNAPTQPAKKVRSALPSADEVLAAAEQAGINLTDASALTAFSKSYAKLSCTKTQEAPTDTVPDSVLMFEAPSYAGNEAQPHKPKQLESAKADQIAEVLAAATQAGTDVRVMDADPQAAVLVDAVLQDSPLPDQTSHAAPDADAASRRITRQEMADAPREKNRTRKSPRSSKRKQQGARDTSPFEVEVLAAASTAEKKSLVTRM